MLVNMPGKLFSPGQLGSKKTTNRLVSQAMEANDAAPGGGVSERTIERYKRLAQGKWGIVVIEATSVTEKSLARRHQLIMHERNLDGFKKLVCEVKQINPDCMLLVQLTHSGQKSHPAFSEPVSICPVSKNGARTLSSDEIQQISIQFAACALLCEKAGADGVDFKMCHGYFGAEMLRPANTRQDRWGGSFENRIRFLQETVASIRSRINNKDFILGSRVSLYEAIRGGCGTADHDELIEDLAAMKQVIKTMHDLGMHYVNVSAGIPGETSEVTRPVKGSERFVLHHLRYTKIVKAYLAALHASMQTIGSAYSVLKQEGVYLADEIIQKGYSDFVGWGRQSFADPLMPVKLRDGDAVNWCTACSGCSKLMLAQLNDGCIVYDPYYKAQYQTLLRKH